jgi:hypothetical protein
MSSPSPAWLPPLVEYAEIGEWLAYERTIYGIFAADFLNPLSPVRFRGQHVCIKRHPMIDGREAAFWHCISEGQGEENRTPDFHRCARIRWLRACIEHERDLKVWREKRKGEERYHLWLESEGYIIVLAWRRGSNGRPYLLLWTAYHVRHEHERQKYENRYSQFRND